MISLEKWYILTPLQKLPKIVRDLGKLIVAKGFKKLPTVQQIAQSGHTGYEIGSNIDQQNGGFFKNGPAQVFQSFQANNTIFSTNQCEKCLSVYGAGIQTHNLMNMNMNP